MSENVTTVDDQGFEELVMKSDVPVLVDFWAEWCVPCHLISPMVEEVAREYAGKLLAVKINVDDNPDTTMKFGVMTIPTLLLIKDGEVRARLGGARGKDAIVREIAPFMAA